jgi:hypothetical protein|tara:strand:- start:1370 stop:1879 length:510 start_codon:yes stop_codon:yes gene_type:complete
MAFKMKGWSGWQNSPLQGKKGLWANIHAKRERGEAPAKPGDEDYPTDEALRESALAMKGDLNKDGKMSDYETNRQNAIDKAMENSPLEYEKNPKDFVKRKKKPMGPHNKNIVYKNGKKYYKASDGTLHTGQVDDYERELAEDKKFKNKKKKIDTTQIDLLKKRNRYTKE